jgi:hypothetical protein
MQVTAATTGATAGIAKNTGAITIVTTISVNTDSLVLAELKQTR